MASLQGQRVVVTGGSRGLGLGLVEALVAREARVTVVARGEAGLAEVRQRLGVEVIAGDVTERALAERVLGQVRPSVVVLNAGAVPVMAPLDEQTWEGFSNTWETDTRAGLHWIQAALRLPLDRGSRVQLVSSGAALAGSPWSGGYAGAKRMLWVMASYANQLAAERDLGLRFQAIVPRQMVGGTGVGGAGARAYARKKGVSPEEFLAGFGPPLPPRAFGEHVVTLLTDPAYEGGTAFSLRGDTGIRSLDDG